MKIIDCTSFYNEHMMYEIRLNVLKDKVDKFIVTESTYSHSGKKKKLNFDINNYPKFKDKIKYIVIDKEPDGIVEENNNCLWLYLFDFDFLMHFKFIVNTLFVYINYSY